MLKTNRKLLVKDLLICGTCSKINIRICKEVIAIDQLSQSHVWSCRDIAETMTALSAGKSHQTESHMLTLLGGIYSLIKMSRLCNNYNQLRVQLSTESRPKHIFKNIENANQSRGSKAFNQVFQ